MKIGYKDIWIDVDINNTKKWLKLFSEKIKNHVSENKICEYTVCLVDERYYLTGYIIQYGVLKTSCKKFLKMLHPVECAALFQQPLLQDFINHENFKFLSEQLNGYEIDIPETFDFCIKL